MHRIKEIDMQSIQKKAPLANNHISVDCVVIGFDGEQLKVLLVKSAGEDNGEVYHDMKLPGSLIYMDEDLDEAAQRVLYELTGLRNVNLMQFKAFGSKNRTSNPKDVRWLERAMQSRVERIVTIAYLSMVKIDRALDKNLDDHQACWIALKDVMTLAFDHNLIIKEAMTYIRQFVAFSYTHLYVYKRQVLACVCFTASYIVLKTGIPSTSVPPLPGEVPPTTFVPYSFIFLA